jgi:hypothetical protein
MIHSKEHSGVIRSRDLNALSSSLTPGCLNAGQGITRSQMVLCALPCLTETVSIVLNHGAHWTIYVLVSRQPSAGATNRDA